MSELSIFVDESGDLGEMSRYYLVAFIVHDQADDVERTVSLYERALHDKNLDDLPFHFGPLLTGHEHYESMEIDARKQYLAAFRIFAEQSPYLYHPFIYRKKAFGNDTDRLLRALKMDLANFLADNLAFFQQFDKVKVYYDNGQSEVTHILHDAIEFALSKEAIVYRIVSPADYRLFQLADYICGIELTAAKYERGTSTKTDEAFFGGSSNFKKNYLKKIRKKLLR